MTKQSLNKDNFALVLTGGEKGTAVLSALKHAGWIEFRVDEFLKRFPEEKLPEWFSITAPVRRIGTVRWKKEHQSRGLDMPEKKRFEIYRDIADCVDLLDVEIKSNIAGDVIRLARNKGKKIIVSHHNFSKTPSCRDLDKILREGIKLRPDVVKIATLVRSENELLSLLAFTCRHAGEFPLVVIPMGVPAMERLMPLSFGSLFTYVSLENRTAPGQISCRLLREMFRLPWT